jgi:hypothetical protein
MSPSPNMAKLLAEKPFSNKSEGNITEKWEINKTDYKTNE